MTIDNFEEEIYRENILDHYKNPRNYGEMQDCTFSHQESNILCGDIIAMYVKLDNESVEDAAFVGTGCAISKAGASMLTDFVKKKTLEEIKNIGNNNIIRMLGIPISIVRMKCALLSITALRNGIKKYEDKK